jgi:HPt (histidine-containing phosphotransfer) domain-containing protein
MTMDWVRSSAGGRIALARRAAETFLSVVPEHLAAVDRAVADNDAGALAAAAHRLNGSALTFRDAAVQRAATSIEQLATGGDMAGATAVVGELRAAVHRLTKALAEWLAAAG